MGKETPRSARHRRHARVRAKVEGNTSRPRLCVFQSLKHIYAQVIDDLQGHTLASASTLEPELADKLAGKAKTGRAEVIGFAVAERALAKGIKEAVFDRGGYKYHGRIQALADGARQAGLNF